MVGRPMTEGVASKTPISSKGMGVGKCSATGKLVLKLATSSEGDKWHVRERTRGVDGAEGVSSGSGLSETEKEVAPCAVRCRANEGEMLGERLAHFIIRRNAGVWRVNK